MKSLPDARQSATHRQGLWRFLSNEKVTPGKLGAPLLAQAQQASEGDCDNYVLIMHDWSRINYNRHTSKRDRERMTHESDLGYELQSSLAVSDRHGAPLGAVAQNLVTSEAILSSWREPTCRPPGAQGVPNHLDELTERIGWLEQNGPWPLPLVHIVDREADSVGHLRQWTAAGQKWLVRTKATRRVRLGREERKVEVIARELDYRLEQQIEYQGQRCGQWVAECPVVLARPARPKRLGPDGRRVPAEPGEPIKVRLVVSRLENTAGQVLATWYLLSNLPSECTAATLSLWYYYRWRIESYFNPDLSLGRPVPSIGVQLCKTAFPLLRHPCLRAPWRPSFGIFAPVLLAHRPGYGLVARARICSKDGSPSSRALMTNLGLNCSNKAASSSNIGNRKAARRSSNDCSSPLLLVP
jgi:hypothetical protein